MGGERSAGRLWVESGEDGSWGLLLSAQQLEALKAALDVRGAREGALRTALVAQAAVLSASMPGEPLTLPGADAARGGEAAGGSQGVIGCVYVCGGGGLAGQLRSGWACAFVWTGLAFICHSAHPVFTHCSRTAAACSVTP